MSKNGKMTAKPSEAVVPKVPNAYSVVAIPLAPLAVMLWAGISGDHSSGDAANAWGIVGIAMVPVFLVALVVFIVKVAAIKGKVSAAAYRIAESLSRDYGLTVTKPKTLLLTDKAKPRLNPYVVPAVDAYGRSTAITISTDASGSRVIPTVVTPDGEPVPTHQP